MAKRSRKKESSAGSVRDFVTVVFADDIEQARHYRQLLRCNEVPAVIKKHDTHLPGTHGIAVMVPEDFLDEAHVLIESQEVYDDFYDLAFEEDDDAEVCDTDFTDERF